MYHCDSRHIETRKAPRAGLHAKLSDDFLPDTLVAVAILSLLFLIVAAGACVFPDLILMSDQEATRNDLQFLTSRPGVSTALALTALIASLYLRHWLRQAYQTHVFSFCDDRGSDLVLPAIRRALSDIDYHVYILSAYASERARIVYTLEVRAPGKDPERWLRILQALRQAGLVDASMKAPWCPMPVAMRHAA